MESSDAAKPRELEAVNYKLKKPIAEVHLDMHDLNRVDCVYTVYSFAPPRRWR